MHLNSEEGHNVKTIADVFFLSVVFLNDNFNTHTQMYWSKYSPWYFGNIVVGQVVVKCKLKPKAHGFAKKCQCHSFADGFCYYSDKFDFNLLQFTLDTGISYIGFWEE